VKVVARREDGFAHDVELEGGREIVIDEPASAGGTDKGPSPTQLLAASLAGCTAITLELYAERKGWDLGALEVEVDYTASEHQAPASFEVVLRLPDSFDEEQRQRLLKIAARCPVHKVLANEGTIAISERAETI
jgi:putative redox protein